jgi:predicted RNA-binding protein YlxR (DUF448 family)
MIRKKRRAKAPQTSSRTKHIPARTCLGCKSQRPPQDFARFVCDQYGIVRLDRSGNAPGRGAYICFDAVCLRKALKLSRLVSAFKCPVVVPEFDILYQALSMWICERLKSYVQLAQKAGVLVSGSMSLQQALTHAKVVCVVLARDIVGSRAETYRSWCLRHNIPCLTFFTKEELGQLIGKSNRSAIGFTELHFCRQVTTAIKSLEKLRSSHGPPETNTSFCQLSS